MLQNFKDNKACDCCALGRKLERLRVRDAMCAIITAFNVTLTTAANDAFAPTAICQTAEPGPATHAITILPDTPKIAYTT